MSLRVDVTLPRRNFTLDLQFQMDRETLGVYGHSGAGKTSLFSLINGLEQPQSGRIELNGRVLVDSARNISLAPQKRRIGTVFQEKLLFPHMTIEENLLFGVPYSAKQKIPLREVIELLDLGRMLKSYPAQISGGEQQRTAIGRALLTSPELLLLDEPFNAVDNSLRSNILPYLRRVRNEMHIPMLVISHDLPDLQRLTEKLLILKEGKAAGFGNIQELMAREGLEHELSGVVNSLCINEAVPVSSSLYSCSVEGLARPVMSPYDSAPPFTLIIPPEDIALSHKEIKGISMQNQLPGKVVKLIKMRDYLLCQVDTGILLSVRVSYESAEELDLTIGREVSCLFKAHSLTI